MSKVHNLNQAGPGGDLIALAHVQFVHRAVEVRLHRFAAGQAHQLIARGNGITLRHVELAHRTRRPGGQRLMIDDADRPGEGQGVGDGAARGGIQRIGGGRLRLPRGQDEEHEGSGGQRQHKHPCDEPPQPAALFFRLSHGHSSPSFCASASAGPE